MMRRCLRRVAAVAVLGITAAGCTAAAEGNPMASAEDGTGPRAARVLALGDSYVIGESIAPDRRWPVQLVERLRGEGLTVADPELVARTGWTTDELDAAIDRADPRGPFDLVLLQIGVNDQFRGRTLGPYRDRVAALIARAIAFAGGEPRRVIVASIPDWGATPFGDGRNRERISERIDAFNAINRDAAEAAGAAWVDVTPVSREVPARPELVADDGLHPSAAQYAAWAALAQAPAREALAIDR